MTLVPASWSCPCRTSTSTRRDLDHRGNGDGESRHRHEEPGPGRRDQGRDRRHLRPTGDPRALREAMTSAGEPGARPSAWGAAGQAARRAAYARRLYGQGRCHRRGLRIGLFRPEMAADGAVLSSGFTWPHEPVLPDASDLHSATRTRKQGEIDESACVGVRRLVAALVVVAFGALDASARSAAAPLCAFRESTTQSGQQGDRRVPRRPERLSAELPRPSPSWPTATTSSTRRPELQRERHAAVDDRATSVRRRSGTDLVLASEPFYPPPYLDLGATAFPEFACPSGGGGGTGGGGGGGAST